MKNAKRIVALLLCLALLVSAAAAILVFAAETEQEIENETTQVPSVDPNCTVSVPAGKWTFSSILRNGPYAPDGNAYNYSTTNYELWNIVESGEDKFVSMRTKGSGVKFEPDFFPQTADGSIGETADMFKIKDYNTMITQFEVIKTGACDNINMTSLIRASGSYRLASAVRLNELLNTGNVQIGELAQITIVMHAEIGEDNVISAQSHYFVNGVYCRSLTASGFTAEMTDGAMWYGVRFCASAEDGVGVNLLIDNIDARVYNRDVLDINNYILDEYNPFLADGFKSLADELPAIATVNDVPYYTVPALNAALEAATEPVNIEFLHDYTQIWSDKVAVNCNATINTNGFISTDSLDLAGVSCAVDGNTITTVVSNWAMRPLTTTDSYDALAASAVKSPVTIGDGSSMWFNTLTDGQYAIHTADGNEFLSLNGASGYSHLSTVSASSADYKLDKTPYMIIQFDSCYVGAAPGGTLRPVAQQPGTNAFAIHNSILYNGLASGEMAQFTFVFFATANDDGVSGVGGCNVYRNGKLIYESGNTFTYAELSKAHHNGIRTYLDSKTTLILDNLHTAHYAENPVTLGEDGNYTFGSGDQFASAEYTQLKMPAIATVNGVEYSSLDALGAELSKIHNAPAEVVFLHNYTATPWYNGTKVAVNCSANINTQGFITADDLNLANVGTSVNGNVISTFAPNYTSEKASTNIDFRGAVTSDFANNRFNPTFDPTDIWNIITTADGNKFAHFHTTGDSTKAQIDISPGTSYRDFNDYPTFVLQMEMIKTGKINNARLTLLGKTTGSSLMYPVNAGIHFSNILKDVAIGELAQITFVFRAIPGETEGTGVVTTQAFVNGVCKSPSSVVTTFDGTTDMNFDNSYWQAARLVFSESNCDIEAYVDNVYATSYTKDVEAVYESGMLKEEYSQFARADHKALTLPKVALIDGESVTYEEAEALLADGGNHTVELLHNPIKNFVVQSNSTIKLNGYGGIVAGNGYLYTEANGVITVAQDMRLVNINVAYEGEIIATIENALYSVDHEALIRAYAYENALHENSVYVKDGKYYEIIWEDFTKPEYAPEITYNVTLGELLPILVVNSNTNRVVNDQLTYTDGVLTDGLDVKYPTVLYFNDDVNSTAVLPVNSASNKMVWQLNGYTYNYTGKNDSHAFSLDKEDEIVINNGTINARGGGSYMMGFADNPTMTLNNVNFSVSVNGADWRSGKLTFNDSVLTNLHMSIGARVGGDTYVVFDGCTITSKSYVIFEYYDNDNFNYAAGALTNYARHITVKNSTIKVNGALVGMPHEDAINLAEGETNNRLFYVENSNINAQCISSKTEMEGVVKFGEGVKFAIESDLDLITADTDVQLFVKTNDIAFSYVATKNYATVIWAEGVVEYWADGSVPTAPDAAYKSLAVGAVAAGNEYNFENTAGAAAEFELLANLTLHTKVFYNFYVEGAESVTINGTIVEGVNGRYSYELLPKYALGELHIVVRFADGSVYSKTTTLVEYVEKSTEATDTENYDALVQVYATLLKYLLEVQTYEVAPLAYTAARAYISENAPVSAENNGEMDANIATYFESATFILDGEVKLVLKSNGTIDLDNAVIMVGGETAISIVADDQLYVILPAYLLAEDIEITIGDATVTYSLAVYAKNVDAGATAVANALYDYANASKLYVDLLNTAE